MRKLIVSNFVTLDGYYEGPDKSVNSLYDYYHQDSAADHSFDHYNAELMRDSNFLLLSRTAFLGNQEYWSGVADDPQASAIRKEIAALMSCLEKLVISDKLTPRKLTAWKNTRIIKRDAAYAGLAAIKQQSGQRRSRDLEPSALE